MEHQLAKKSTQKEQSKEPASSSPSQQVSSHRATTHPLLRLQRAVGNQAVQRLLHPGKIQAKLAVGQPGDVYEQKADHTAQQVVTSPPPHALQRSATNSTNTHQTSTASRTIPPLQQKGRGQSPPSDTLSQNQNPLQEAPHQKKNTTGLPETLKARVEQLSGMSLDDVQMHYNSPRPAEIQALAYTQGTDIYVGPRQEQHLAHEAWHVVQQKQGRVKPTLQARGVPINDDVGLEREADVMGERAMDALNNDTRTLSPDRILQLQRTAGNRAVQRLITEQSSTAAVQREPKRTEKAVLAEAQISGLNDENSQKLIDKMVKKGQDYKHARKIAEEIETESENLVAALPGPLLGGQQYNIRAAIKNYVASSIAIQTSARGNPGAVNQNVLDLDAALQVIRQQLQNIGAANERIVYRSITYDNGGADIPYGQAANGQQINVGDYVGDKGFLSTSEHRQFVLGKEQTGRIPGILKVAIYSKTGVPIALHFPQIAYSNANQDALYQLKEDKKNYFSQVWNKVFGAGAMAGQAEVLFSRNSVFEVKKIQRDGDKVSVVLEEFVVTGAVPRPPVVRNMKDGKPL